MTISTTANSVTISGNGATSVFNFSFVAGSASNIVVIFTDATGNETTLLTSQYTLFLNAPAAGAIWGVGGTVTYPTTGSPIAAGTTLTIERIVPLTQVVSISNQGDFYPQAVEQAMDVLEMQIQQIGAIPSRAIQAPAVDISPQMVLPPAAQRAGLFVAFDSSGNVIVASSTGGGAIVSAAMIPVVEAATLALARTAMGLGSAAVASTGASGHTLPFLDIGNTFSADQEVDSSDAGAAAGPTFGLYRNSASPAASDLLGQALFSANSSTGIKRAVAAILANYLDPTNTSEDAELWLETIVAGTLAVRAKIGQGMQLGAPTGGDKGAGTLNATGVFVNGSSVVVGLTAQVRAWGFFNSSQVLQQGSAGVSIVKNGVGDYTVTHGAAMAGSTYVILLNLDTSPSGAVGSLPGASTIGAVFKSTASFRMGIWASSVAADLGFSFAIFGL